MIIRYGTIDDCADINRIYNWYIENSTITFDVEPWNLERRRQWFDQFVTNQNHVLVVAEIEGEVAGFAYNGMFRPKAAYQTSTEVTIYTDNQLPDINRPAGIASALYRELFLNLVGDKSFT